MDTENVALVEFIAIVTILEPSSPDATKSLPAASDTDRFTVRSAVGAAVAVTVKVAAEPSVTAEPPEIVIVGPGVCRGTRASDRAASSGGGASSGGAALSVRAASTRWSGLCSNPLYDSTAAVPDATDVIDPPLASSPFAGTATPCEE